jgi:hypothetical protein
MPDDARHRVLYRLVGQLITNWAHVEWQLMLLASALLRTDMNRGRFIMAAFTSSRAKREFISRLGRSYLLDNDMDRFLGLVGKIKHLSEKRNMLAHWRVYYLRASTFRLFNDDDPTQPNTFGRYQNVQIANIRNWSKEIHDLQEEITHFSIIAIRGDLLEQPRIIPEPTAYLDP